MCLEQLFKENRGNIRNFPVEKILNQSPQNQEDRIAACCQFLNQKNGEDHKIQELLYFLFSIYCLSSNLKDQDFTPPDNIMDYVNNHLKKLKKYHNLNCNRDLEQSLLSYLGYDLPRHNNGKRDIYFTIIREAGYHYLRFAKELRFRLEKIQNQNYERYDQLIQTIQLPISYGYEREQDEIRDFFLNLQEDNFQEKAEVLGYPETFFNRLKEYINQPIQREGGHITLWQLQETSVKCLYDQAHNRLLLSLPERANFINRGDEVRIRFTNINNEQKLAYYSKNSDGKYNLSRIDADITLDYAYEIVLIDVINATTKKIANDWQPPTFLKSSILWDLTSRKIVPIEKSGEFIDLTHEYAIFNPKENSKVFLWDDESGEKTEVQYGQSYTIQSSSQHFIFVNTDAETGENVEIDLSVKNGNGKLNYNAILDISPDKRSYRYFRSDTCPIIQDGQINQITLTWNDGNTSNIDLNGQWTNIPLEQCWTSCTVRAGNHQYRNIYFIPSDDIESWLETTNSNYDFTEEVNLNFANINIQFQQWENEINTELQNHHNLQVKLTIPRQGFRLVLSDKTFVSLEDANNISLTDFKSAILEYHCGNNPETPYRHLTFETSTQINGQTQLSLFKYPLDIHANGIASLALGKLMSKECFKEAFEQKNITFYIFQHRNFIPDPNNTEKSGIPWNNGIGTYLPKYLSRWIYGDYQHQRKIQANYTLQLNDLTKDEVKFENNCCIHKIPREIAKNTSRYIYCLPMENQDSEWTVLPISPTALSGNDLIFFEKIGQDELFSNANLCNKHGLLCFFVYEKQNGILERYSPGFFRPNPNLPEDEQLTPLQSALISTNLEELNNYFSNPENNTQNFIEKVFGNAEKINAQHFFNCFFNKLREEGKYKYKVASGYVFRNANYWLQTVFEQAANQTVNNKRLCEHWDYELFGYEEIANYLKENNIDWEQATKITKEDWNKQVRSSLFFFILFKQDNSYELGVSRNTAVNNILNQISTDNEQPSPSNPLLLSKIIFLINIFNHDRNTPNPIFFPRNDTFSSLDRNVYSIQHLFFALQQLAQRIHNWKKSPKLSPINDREQDRFNGNDPYYSTEQYIRGELVYWRQQQFSYLRELLLIFIANETYADQETRQMFDFLLKTTNKNPLEKSCLN